MYTALGQNCAVGIITGGLAAVDQHARSKSTREAKFPMKLLDVGIGFSCLEGEASEASDADRIKAEIGDKSTQLDNLVHGVVAQCGLQRAINQGGEQALRYLEAMQRGSARNVEVDLAGGEDKEECVLQVMGVLNAETCLSLSLKTKNLLALPESVGRLGALTKFSLKECSSLAALPESVGRLSALTRLSLKDCSGLALLPESVGGLGCLTWLTLTGCSSLTALPETIGGLRKLSWLYLDGCSSLAALPEGVGGLRGLTFLDMTECTSMVALPESVSGLSALTCLILRGCTSLVALPESVNRLGALTWLVLNGCTSLTTLPENLGRFCSLKALLLHYLIHSHVRVR